MIKNYIRVALRNLVKFKGFSIINISGLVVGLTCAMLIWTYVQHELSYDRFHQRADDIYRIVWITPSPQTRTPHPMAQAMVRDFPEVVDAVTLSPLFGLGQARPKVPIRYGDKRFEERGFLSADSTFFKVFPFEFLQGNGESALIEPGGVVITEETARKYFGDVNAVGKTMILEADQEFPLQVTGVIENMPENSHFDFDFLISYVTLKPLEDGSYFEWADFGHFNYIVLAPGTDAKAVEAKIPAWVETYLNWSGEGLERLRGGVAKFELQPLTDIHLHSNLRWELEPNGDMTYVYLFSSAAVLIILIACINFTNLSTARASRRAKEVGIRKVVGSNRAQLIGQFLGESILLSFLATLISAALVEALVPTFNDIVGKELSFNLLSDAGTLGVVLAGALLVGLLAGSYPAFLLSSFKPVSILKGKFRAELGVFNLRRIMVVLQFTISIALIASTGIISSQLSYLRNKELGFDKEQILVLPIRNAEMRQNYESLKGQLLQHPAIIQATAASSVPGREFNQNPVSWQPDGRSIGFAEYRVDYDFFATLGMEIVQGRGFTREFSTDLQQAFIVNETGAKQFTWEAPIGEELVWYDDDVTLRARVIGVVSDFHFQSLRKNIGPLIFQVLPSEFNYMILKVNSRDLPNLLAFLESKWTELDPSHSFEYGFLDQDFASLYRAEENMQAIFGYFTVLAILVSCLGLYGLITFSAQQRIKEIGIRKVLGASISGIVRLLSKEYLQLIVVANLVAWPLAWLVMENWLKDFAYRTEISWWIFAGAGTLTLVLAILTVSVQATKAAMANTSESLRYE